jgi:hypothetical protein
MTAFQILGVHPSPKFTPVLCRGLHGLSRRELTNGTAPWPFAQILPGHPITGLEVRHGEGCGTLEQVARFFGAPVSGAFQQESRK